MRTISQKLSYSHQKKTFKKKLLEVSRYHRALRKWQTGPGMTHLDTFNILELKEWKRNFWKKSVFAVKFQVFWVLTQKNSDDENFSSPQKCSKTVEERPEQVCMPIEGCVADSVVTGWWKTWKRPKIMFWDYTWHATYIERAKSRISRVIFFLLLELKLDIPLPLLKTLVHGQISKQ